MVVTSAVLLLFSCATIPESDGPELSISPPRGLYQSRAGTPLPVPEAPLPEPTMRYVPLSGQELIVLLPAVTVPAIPVASAAAVPAPADPPVADPVVEAPVVPTTPAPMRERIPDTGGESETPGDRAVLVEQLEDHRQDESSAAAPPVAAAPGATTAPPAVAILPLETPPALEAPPETETPPLPETPLAPAVAAVPSPSDETDRRQPPENRIEADRASPGGAPPDSAEAGPSLEEAPPPPRSVTTLPPVPPRDPTVARREVSSGERFTVSLPGPGWIYLGSSRQIEFLGRESVESGVRFFFRLPPQTETGGDHTAELLFEQQDLTSGTRNSHTEEIIPRLAAVEEPPGARTAPRSSVPDQNRAGQAEIAADEASAPSPTDPGSPDFLPRIETLFERGDVMEARTLLEDALEQLNYSSAELLFRLAQLLEEPGDHRDLRRSRELYQRVRDEFPFSVYRERSRARIEFLDRHFFLIR